MKTPAPLSALLIGLMIVLGCSGPASSGNETSTDPDVNPPLLVNVNKSGNYLAFINPETMTELGRAETGNNPHEVAVTPDQSTALVTNFGHGDGTTLSVIDVAKRKETGRIDLSPGKGPHGIDIHPNGQYAYVTCETGTNEVLEVDLDSQDVTRRFKTGQKQTHMVVLHPEKKKLFTGNIGAGTSTVIDLDRGKAIKHIRTDGGAEGIDLAPDGEQVWVTNRAESVSVIDTSSNERIETMECSGTPIRVQVTPDGSEALVSTLKSNRVAVFDTDERTITKRIETGEGPVGLAIDPDGTFAYVANTGADSVMKIDLQRDEVVKVLEKGDTPDGLAYISR